MNPPTITRRPLDRGPQKASEQNKKDKGPVPERKYSIDLAQDPRQTATYTGGK